MKRTVVLIISAISFLPFTLLCGCGNNSRKTDLKEPADYTALSAYEIYCKHYIYIDSEKQWIDDLVAGRLDCLDNSILEEKIIWKGSINDNFAKDTIILTIDKYFYDKTFTIEDFHMIEVESVELIADYTKDDTPGNQIYSITLKNAGKENVINSIRKLEIFAFTNSAFPNSIDASTNQIANGRKNLTNHRRKCCN